MFSVHRQNCEHICYHICSLWLLYVEHSPFSEDTSRGGETFSNSQPIIRNHIDFLNATLGMLFRYQVPTVSPLTDFIIMHFVAYS